MGSGLRTVGAVLVAAMLMGGAAAVQAARERRFPPPPPPEDSLYLTSVSYTHLTLPTNREV